MGKKFPTIKEGLDWLVDVRESGHIAYMLWLSLRIVKEKQQGISAVSPLPVGLRRVQLVSMAFCCWSKQMAQNFSQ